MIEETGEHIVAGAGELHLEICLKDLQDDFMGGAEIKVGCMTCIWFCISNSLYVSKFPLFNKVLGKANWH
jgi:hypothetical protein